VVVAAGWPLGARSTAAGRQVTKHVRRHGALAGLLVSNLLDRGHLADQCADPAS
jgi:hypothetical protein